MTELNTKYTKKYHIKIRIVNIYIDTYFIHIVSNNTRIAIEPKLFAFQSHATRFI